MLKKVVNKVVVFIALFSFFNCNVIAYDYINPSNKIGVNETINEIFTSKEQYEDLAGVYEENTVMINDATSTSYWWPVGSIETTEVDGKVFAKGEPETLHISSNFGYRIHPLTGKRKLHSGIDIAGGRGLNQVNIIAAKDGIVVYPTAGVSNNCPTSSSLSSCGGGYGNYVIIQHSDGNYTLYAHLYENTITVKEGDSVSQGQVIAKMGSSGNSTGMHLHFEIREGNNAYGSTVDPLEYISAENPREVLITLDGSYGEFIEWIKSWEGAGRKEGDYYIVEDLQDGVHTVGTGVTLEYCGDLFRQYGINPNQYMYHGAKIPADIVDKVKLERFNMDRSAIERQIASCSITLSENQLQALTSNRYNVGNTDGLCDAYKKYGDTEDFYNNWLLPSKLLKGTQFEKGLRRRRAAEWDLFHRGVYTYNR